NFQRGTFSPDGRRIVVGGSDGVIRSWYGWRDLSSYSLALLHGSEGNVRSVAFGPPPMDQNVFASVAPSQQSIHIWSVFSSLFHNLRTVASDRPSPPPPDATHLHAEGKGIALDCDEAGDTCVIQSDVPGVDSGPLRLPRSHPNLRAAAFSRDGTWLAIAPAK